MMHKLTSLDRGMLAVLALPLLGACSSSTDTTQCLTSGDRAYAVAVTLMDSATGARTPFDSVVGRVTEDNVVIDSVDFSSLLRSPIPPPLYVVQMAAFRPGLYTVEITAKGYLPWI